ncbi:MAG: RluA family pseudouridine synthase [Bulleidia sp.]
MIKVLYEDNHLLCIEKPINMPAQPDSSHDASVLDVCKSYLRETYAKKGNVFCAPVHRLDRPVGGVMVLARTSKAASRLSETIRTHRMVKTYLAVLDGIPPEKEGTLTDYLYKDAACNRVSVVDAAHGKKAFLSYRVLSEQDGKALVAVTLGSGRSHQIRVQFASRNLPLVYDQRYNLHTQKGPIALWAWRLEFPHPVTKENIRIAALPPERDPWNVFERKLYEKGKPIG